MHVVFVCTGNTCRSPMAEAWFRHLCTQQQLEVMVSSAGLMAAAGQPATVEAGLALARHGLTLTDFRSSPMTPELAHSATVMVAMSRRHAAALRRLYPTLTDRILTMRALVDSDGDVADPIGGDLSVYEQCLASMKPALDALARQVAATSLPDAPDEPPQPSPRQRVTKGD